MDSCNGMSVLSTGTCLTRFVRTYTPVVDVLDILYIGIRVYIARYYQTSRRARRLHHYISTIHPLFHVYFGTYAAFTTTRAIFIRMVSEQMKDFLLDWYSSFLILVIMLRFFLSNPNGFLRYETRVAAHIAHTPAFLVLVGLFCYSYFYECPSDTSHGPGIFMVPCVVRAWWGSIVLTTAIAVVSFVFVLVVLRQVGHREDR